MTAIAHIVFVEAIDQSGQHSYDTGKYFLPGANTIDRDDALSDRRIEAGGALEGRAAGIIEKLGPLKALAFTVPFGRIEKY